MLIALTINGKTYESFHSEETPFIYGVESFTKSIGASPSDYDITLVKGLAFDHEFLLKTSIVSSVPVPTGRSLSSKVVKFERKGKIVYLFESTAGKLSSLSLPTKILLAEFPILWETEKTITIDFKKGMKELYYVNSSFASDIQREVKEKTFKITKSYIDRVETRGKSLFIDHYVRVDIPGMLPTKNTNMMAQLKYVLSSYKKNDQFKSKTSSFMNKVGYFELPPLKDPKNPDPSQQVKVNILKFDSQNPVIYSLSSNIPEEFKQPVIDGILYWNQAFGKEFIKIKELPQDITPHEPGYNIVQWLDWDTAGFAYADISPDPLTGEIKQSHVYLTSVFGKQAKMNARKFLLQILANQKKAPTPDNTLNIKGFKIGHSCKKDFMKSLTLFANDLMKLTDGVSNKKFDEIFNRFAKDYVRQVVAHEVGHTLGLRHNFAGSLLTNLNKKNLNPVASSYLFTGKLAEGVIPSSSVMDYLGGMTASMLGAHIRLKRGALPYDKMAIDWGYFDRPLKSGIPFCTDGHSIKGKFIDCKPWDKFSSPIEQNVYNWESIMKGLPLSLAFKFSFLGEKTEVDRLKKLKSLSLFPHQNAILLLNFIEPLLKSVHPESQFLKIKMLNPNFDSLYLDQYEKVTNDFKMSEFKRFGGLGKIFLGNFTPQENSLSPAFLEMRERLSLNLSNLFKIDNLPEEETSVLNKIIENYFVLLEKEFLFLLSESLQKVQFSFRELSFVDSLEKFSNTLLFKKSNNVLATLEDQTQVYRPMYQYLSKGKDLRKNVTSLLKADFFPKYPSFNRKMKKVRKNIYETYLKETTLILGEEELEDVESDNLYDFLFLERKMFEELKRDKR